MEDPLQRLLLDTKKGQFMDYSFVLQLRDNDHPAFPLFCDVHACIKKVRMVFKHVSKAGGVYRKRIASTGRAYMKHNEFCDCVNRADVEKLTRMIKILSFLIQTKVYLFWKKRF